MRFKKIGFKPEQFRQLSSRYNLLSAFKTNKALKIISQYKKYNEDYKRKIL